MTDQLLMSLYIFALAGFVGHYVIESVPPLLHTPLMAGTNAISGIALVGSLVVAGSEYSTLATVLGTIAVTCASINTVGGFLITDRMLRMFKSKEAQARSQEVMSQTWLELLVLGRVALLHHDAAAAELAQDRATRRVAGRDRHDGGGARHRAPAPRHRRPTAGSRSAFILGSVIGGAMSFIPMTKMPERIALSHCFGGLAAALVGIAEYQHRMDAGHLDRITAGRARLRGVLRSDHVYRLADGVRQAAGLHHRRAGHLPRPELPQRRRCSSAAIAR